MTAKFFGLVLAVFMASAQAQSGVDLRRFGLEDVADAAECASRNMGSGASVDVLSTYWGPPLMYDGQCVSSYSVVDAESKRRARTSLLLALSSCRGREFKNDSDPWVRRVGYATAVIAAKGMNNWTTGKSKLSEYVERTVACQ